MLVHLLGLRSPTWRQPGTTTAETPVDFFADHYLSSTSHLTPLARSLLEVAVAECADQEEMSLARNAIRDEHAAVTLELQDMQKQYEKDVRRMEKEMENMETGMDRRVRQKKKYLEDLGKALRRAAASATRNSIDSIADGKDEPRKCLSQRTVED